MRRVFKHPIFIFPRDATTGGVIVVLLQTVYHMVGAFGNKADEKGGGFHV